MWLSLAETCVFLGVVLFVPGAIILRSLSASRVTALACAPIVSVFILVVLGIAYAKAGIGSNGVSLLAPLFLFALVVYVAYRVVELRRGKPSGISGSCVRASLKSEWAMPALYVAAAIVLGLVFFVVPLDGADSFGQDADNTWHLSLIKSFASSGNMSILEAGLFWDLSSMESTVVSTGTSFYPAAWHLLAALGVCSLGVSVTLAVNSLNLVLLVLVYPLGMFALLSEIFPGDKRKIALGSIVSLAFIAFPWCMLLPRLGPLYPNYFAMCLVPVVVYSVLRLFRGGGAKFYLTGIGFVVLSLGACSFAHPNAVFTSAVFLFPFVVQRMYELGKRMTANRGNVKALPALLVGALLVAFVLFWIICYRLPFMQGVVTFMWPPYSTLLETVGNILLLSYRGYGGQLVLGVLVVIGAAVAVRSGRRAWLVASYMLMCILCLVAATQVGVLRSVLTGFWYTDPTRLAANAAFAGIPLAVLGVDWALGLAGRAVGRASTTKRELSSNVAVAVAGIALIIAVFCPYHDGSFKWGDDADRLAPVFGTFKEDLSYSNSASRANLFDPKERDFCERVAKKVEPGALVYNNADDGSTFSYPLYGLDLCYRRSDVGAETQTGELLRLQMNEISSNSEVQEAVRESQIQYVLILDMGGEPLAERTYYGYYKQDSWKGLNEINDDTPGFEVILAESDMRLYKIADEYAE